MFYNLARKQGRPRKYFSLLSNKRTVSLIIYSDIKENSIKVTFGKLILKALLVAIRSLVIFHNADDHCFLYTQSYQIHFLGDTNLINCIDVLGKD